MKLPKYFVFLLLLPALSTAQNLPACDTLLINCCTYGPGTVSLLAENPSSELFPYPGFALFNQIGDTIAIETVFYFGIGFSWQPHTMDVVAPLNLPFSGFLNLYMLFYDTLACSFPITLPDTTTGIQVIDPGVSTATVFPNPVTQFAIIQVRDPLLIGREAQLSLEDMTGRQVLRSNAWFNREGTTSLDAGDLFPGVYLLRITSETTREVVRFVKR